MSALDLMVGDTVVTNDGDVGYVVADGREGHNMLLPHARYIIAMTADVLSPYASLVSFTEAGEEVGDEDCRIQFVNGEEISEGVTCRL